jgi:hypothetical protein
MASKDVCLLFLLVFKGRDNPVFHFGTIPKWQVDYPLITDPSFMHSTATSDGTDIANEDEVFASCHC